LTGFSSGDDELSHQMDESWASKDVERICRQSGCVGLKLEAQRSFSLSVHCSFNFGLVKGIHKQIHCNIHHFLLILLT